MKKIAFVFPVSLLFLLLLALPDAVLAKKGGIGKGGGYSEDGILYHSHSERSYSGKDNFKGKGQANAYGRTKSKNKGMNNTTRVDNTVLR
jgi:hypothetical protein